MFILQRVSWRFAVTFFALASCLVGYAPGQELLAPPAENSGASTAPEDVAKNSGEVTTSPELAAILRRLDELEQAEAARVKEADKKSAAEKKAAEEKKKAEDEKTADDAKIVTFEPWTDMSQDKWTVKLGGHVQMDYVNWADASPSIVGDQDYFEFRRLRLVADGTGYGMFDFRLQTTLEPEAIDEIPAGSPSYPDVKDAYLSMNEIPHLGRFRIGNFFVPFGLEQVTNDTNNIFMERSIPTQGVFTADREVGVALYNCTDDQRITWTTGAFFDSISESIKERIDDNQGIRVSGRLTWLPYYDEVSNGRYLIHTGCGILYTDDQNDSVRFRARPQIHEGPRLIDSLALAADDYTTANAELATVVGRFTMQSEAYVSQVNRLNANDNTFYGGYVHFSYFLTGENRIYERFGQHGAQFGRNVPFSNFFVVPSGYSPGAWELKTRWSHLNLDDVNRGQYNDFTFGFNWYWSDRTRVMFDWIHPFTSSEARFGEAEADILAMRFDFNW